MPQPLDSVQGCSSLSTKKGCWEPRHVGLLPMQQNVLAPSTCGPLTHFLSATSTGLTLPQGYALPALHTAPCTVTHTRDSPEIVPSTEIMQQVAQLEAIALVRRYHYDHCTLTSVAGSGTRPVPEGLQTSAPSQPPVRQGYIAPEARGNIFLFQFVFQNYLKDTNIDLPSAGQLHKCPPSQGYGRPKPGAWDSTCVSPMGDKDHVLEPSRLPPGCASAASCTDRGTEQPHFFH